MHLHPHGVRKWIDEHHGLVVDVPFIRDSGFARLARLDVGGQPHAWLRVHPPGTSTLREVEAIGEAARVASAQGVRITAPIPRRDGALAGTYDGCPAIVYQHAAGSVLHQLDDSNPNALGAELAALHAVPTAGIDGLPPLGRGQLIEAPLGVLRGKRHVAPSALRAIEALVERAADQWTSAGSLAEGLLHGDARVANSVHSETDEPTWLDLDQMAHGPFVYDLACLWRKDVVLVDGGAEAAEAAWEAFLAGYATRRPMPARERALIPAFGVLRDVWVTAIVGAHPRAYPRESAWLDDPEYWDEHVEIMRRIERASV
jgi:Ser/Thr protein kinase RdoA (MazF antagonist)